MSVDGKSVGGAGRLNRALPCARKVLATEHTAATSLRGSSPFTRRAPIAHRCSFGLAIDPSRAGRAVVRPTPAIGPQPDAGAKSAGA